MNTKKRNKLEVIYDMLSVLLINKGMVKPTHLMYKANLSHQMMEAYITELVEKEFIIEIKEKDRRVYAITKKGRVFLEKYNTVKDFMNSFGLGE